MAFNAKRDWERRLRSADAAIRAANALTAKLQQEKAQAAQQSESVEEPRHA